MRTQPPIFPAETTFRGPGGEELQLHLPEPAAVEVTDAGMEWRLTILRGATDPAELARVRAELDTARSTIEAQGLGITSCDQELRRREDGLQSKDAKIASLRAQVKTELAAGYLNGKWHDQPDGYSPAGCYRWLRGVQTKVGWHSVIWNPWNTPKHSFLGWIWVHDALKTKSKLLQFGVTDDADCMLCGLGIETQEHLFFDCPYSRRVIHAINQVMGGILATHDMLERSMQHPGSQVQKRVLYALLVCLVYQIWQQRNRYRVDMQVLRPEKLSSLIMQEIRARIRSRDLTLVKQDDVDWLHSLNLL
ncbi:uncharacterized protein LOC141590310 [Silene latifolia]|uniref:uncharacterized protein LOC141590310 n=1 Tax=Silene latifolia TaxID=37657 RepID=UPI003D7731A7